MEHLEKDMENPTLKNITDPNFGKPPKNQSEVSTIEVVLKYWLFSF